MSLIRSLNNFLYSAVETWFVVALTPGVILTCGALAVVGLFIPDSWMDEQATARMNQYLAKGKSVDTLQLEDSHMREGEPHELQEAQEPQENNDSNLESIQEHSPAKMDVLEGNSEDLGKRVGGGQAEELHVCKWCGGKYEQSEGCDCGGTLFRKPSPDKNHNTSDKILPEGNEDKPPFLRWFDKFGASLKRGKLVKDSSVGVSSSEKEKLGKQIKEDTLQSVPSTSSK